MNLALDRGEVFRARSLDSVHKSRHDLIPKLPFARKPHLLDQALEESLFNFTFMREPIARVVSAYADKFMRGASQRRNFLRHIGYEEDFPISLREFIYVLNEMPDLVDLDHHWRPQVKEIAFGDIDYDFIGDIDYLFEDLPAVLRRIFPARDVKIFNSRKRLNHKTRSKKLMSKMSDDERKILQKLYAEDIEAYHWLQAHPFTLPQSA